MAQLQLIVLNGTQLEEIPLAYNSVTQNVETSVVPTGDTDISNKKYVDVQVTSAINAGKTYADQKFASIDLDQGTF